MGDGGVACVPSQHIMEHFSNSCGGGGNNGKFRTKLLNFPDPKMKNQKLKREAVSVDGKRSSSSSSSSKDVEDGQIQEEVEEGELPGEEVENGEFIPEEPRKILVKSEIEKGEFVDEKRTKGDVEKGEFASGKWGKGELGKGEFSSGNYRKWELDEAESWSWRAPKDEVEKGEFVLGRWPKSEVVKDDNSCSKTRGYDSSKDKVWKFDPDRTPPAAKCSGEKEFSRSGSQLIKGSSRWESNQDRNPCISSKIMDGEGSLVDYNNDKREYSSGNRLKRSGADSDGSGRRHYSEFGDYAVPKSRKISDDGNSSACTEHYQRSLVERSCRKSFSSRNISSDSQSSRQDKSSLSSRVYERHNSSPHHYEWSPHDQVRYRDHWDQSPSCRDRSPYDWRHYRDSRNSSPSYSPYDPSRCHDRRNCSPSYSPYDPSHYHDRRNYSPGYSERSPQDEVRYHDQRDSSANFKDRGRFNYYRKINRKIGVNAKRKSQHGSKAEEEKLNQRNIDRRDSRFSAKESEDRSNQDNGDGSSEEIVNHQTHEEEQSSIPCLKESPQVNGTTEELLPMEEDMDICDTPPHVPVVADSKAGKWFYLDHYGVEWGPSRLCDLKILVEEGIIVSDHLIKHADGDRWVTVENAFSPLVTSNFPSIISDTVTQVVPPPEDSGNILAGIGDTVQQSGNQIGEKMMSTSSERVDDTLDASETLANFHLDERVGALLEGCTVLPGRELETLGEVLQMTFKPMEWERLGNIEGLTWHQPHTEEHFDGRGGEHLSSNTDLDSKETTEASSSALSSFDNDEAFSCGGRWCKGGDWKRTDEASQYRLCRKKYVLNDGFPLCLMPKSGYKDPRRHRKDELDYPCSSRRLDLPFWAFSLPDELNDPNSVSKLSQSKPMAARVVKGTMLPVIRINACVVKDQGSLESESRIKARGKDRYSLRSNRHYSSSKTDAKRPPSVEGVSSMKNVRVNDSHGCKKNIISINIPKDRVCTADELQLHMGDWYYLDGAGNEQGPLSSSELQVLADQGIIQKHCSVFRKVDKVWVPVISVAQASRAAGKIQRKNNSCTSIDTTSGASLSESSGDALSLTIPSSSFDSLHPQFIGYTRGRLHELVMKSYKSREFAAAINEVLDPWINVRQPRKEIEKQHRYIPSVNNRFERSDQLRAGKRARYLVDGSEEDYDMGEYIPAVQVDECLFDDLCGDAKFCKEDNVGSQIGIGFWGLLDGLVLARVFHFLKADIKSLVYAALTCKHWRSVSKFYKDICREVDLSSVAPNCTDSMICSILNGYNKEQITSLILRGCTNITSGVLEEVLRLLPSVSSVDIRGCGQFEDLISRLPYINWVKDRASSSRTRSLQDINRSTSSVFKTSNGVIDSENEDSVGLRDYFGSSSKRDGANQLFRRSLYKRSKLFDARKSSSILSRGAHLRRLAIKKSENGYKRMEEFLASSLRGIMKDNTFDFFVSKVTEIEYRMKNGYYAGHGLSSVKEDISRMCRDALKAKIRADTGDMNHIITLFIRLATSLEGVSKSSQERDEMMKIWTDDEAPPGSSSASSKYKKANKVAERKYMNRSNNSSSAINNGVSEYGDCVSDAEIKRHLSKLNRQSMDSGSETSAGSSEENETDSESAASESDLDLLTRGDGNLNAEDGLESFSDDREWGARMTKASLVPPVTRKYEVIDSYVTVADHDEVERKMQVSLPDEYAEKLDAQKNGTEESDMEIPEVKGYKPRKQLGDEVLEQEVYGIDPYTHNLLLDSMPPEESDWPLLDKHAFIEDVLLRTLNKKVRSFMGTGYTPMKYPLQPVIEDILRSAEEAHDTRTVRICQFILKAIRSRPEDNYVSYRKGLGVVCNKEGGFGEDDFVVQFLGEVYPVWKWFEKQDGIRSLQKNSNDPAPEFYNIYLERPKGDADGYDLVVVDAMHKANYASRICHSCRPNCEAKVTAVDGKYQIGIYTVRPIGYGEEVTFDYNSVTESKEEYEASVCLCGSQVCRGSYLNLTGEGAFQKVLNECHGILDRHKLLLEACELNSVSEEDYIDLGRAGLGSCLLGGLPDWLIAYSARLVRFINSERIKLPKEILRYNLEEKRKYFAEICLDVEKSDAEVQAEGVYNQRLQNLALTLDKVRYVMRCVFDDPKKAPPPLERLSPKEAVVFIWKGEGSLVDELLQSMASHMNDGLLNDLKSSIRAHDPSESDDILKELHKSLIWLRDEVRNLPCTYKCRHDAAADLIHIYAFTKCFFRIREYEAVTSPPVYVSPLDLGPKHSHKLGSGLHKYCKTYGENYCLGQLIFWHNQTNAEPDCSLARASRGCLSLPDTGSFYAKMLKSSKHCIYGPRTLKLMLARMVKQSQRPWPDDRIWTFEKTGKVFGSPMLDAVLHNAPLDKEMVHWLKNRPPIFQAMWDR